MHKWNLFRRQVLHLPTLWVHATFYIFIILMGIHNDLLHLDTLPWQKDHQQQLSATWHSCLRFMYTISLWAPLVPDVPISIHLISTCKLRYIIPLGDQCISISQYLFYPNTVSQPLTLSWPSGPHLQKDSIFSTCTCTSANKLCPSDGSSTSSIDTGRCPWYVSHTPAIDVVEVIEVIGENQQVGDSEG